jgi:desulfoferrodoxin-like iron-binding protein
MLIDGEYLCYFLKNPYNYIQRMVNDYGFWNNSELASGTNGQGESPYKNFEELELKKGGALTMGVSKKGEKYRCEICGNEVTVTKVGGGTLVCCGEEMTLIEE